MWRLKSWSQNEKDNCRPQSIEDTVSKGMMSSKVTVADLNGAKIKCKADTKPEWKNTFCQSPHLKEGRETGNKNIVPGRFIDNSNVMVSFTWQLDRSLSHLGREPQRGIGYTRLTWIPRCPSNGYQVSECHVSGGTSLFRCLIIL